MGDDFITQLEELGIKQKPSSAYHSESNYLAERAVGSLKSVLKKSSEKITELHLAEITFAINSHVSSEGSGSNNDRFLGRSVRSRLPKYRGTNLQADQKSRRSHQKEKQDEQTNLSPWR